MLEKACYRLVYNERYLYSVEGSTVKINDGFQYNISLADVKRIGTANLPYVYCDYLDRVIDISDPSKLNLTSREAAHFDVSDPKNLYAEIRVERKAVAAVWKNGVVMTDPKYQDIAVASKSIESPQERVDYFLNSLGGEAVYYRPANRDQAYSFADAMAKITGQYP